MATYSTNLALTLMATGEQSNTWGDTTNTNLGTLIEQSISGYVTQAITDGSGANTTITIPNGATGVARNMFIEMTGALTFSTTSLIVPANKKMYFIFNNTSGGFAVTVKVSGQTGVLVPNGKKVILTSNGTDIVEAHTAIVGNATMGGTLGVTGATTLSSTLAVTGATTLSSTLAAGATTITGAATVSTTLGVTGTATMAAINASGTVAMAGAATVGTTLGVTGTSTMAAINASGTVAMAGAATVGTTLGVTGASTLTGTLGLGITPDVGTGARMRYSLTTAATQYGFFIDPINSSAATTGFTGVAISLRTTNAVYTTTNLLSIVIGDPTKGASHTITNNDAISINDQTAGSTRNSGVRTMLASGAGKYNIITHTAQSVIGGNLRVGGSTDPTVALDVTGAALISTTLGVTGTSTMAAINASGSVTLSGTSFFRSPTTSNTPGTFNFYLAASGIREGTAGDVNIDTYNAGWGSRLAISQAGAVTIPGTLGVTELATFNGGSSGTPSIRCTGTATDGLLQVFQGRNTSAGTSAQTRFALGNNATVVGATLTQYSSTHTTKPNYFDIQNEFSAPLRLSADGGSTHVTITSTGVTIPGTLSVTGAVSAANSYQNVTAATSATFFTTADGSVYLATLNNSFDNYSAVYLITCADGTTAVATQLQRTNANLDVTISGLNVQIYNGIGATRTIDFTYLRLK